MVQKFIVGDELVNNHRKDLKVVIIKFVDDIVYVKTLQPYEWVNKGYSYSFPTSKLSEFTKINKQNKSHYPNWW